MNIVVITSCTMRKRRGVTSVSLAKTEICGKPDVIARRWASRLRQSTIAGKDAFSTALNLYIGRSFAESRKVVEILGADLFVVSAGLGLVHHATKVPNYNLTVAMGEASLKPALSAEDASTADWWQALNNENGTPNPICQLIKGHEGALVLLALPANYIEMISMDLETLDLLSADRLRIFTSKRGADFIPSHLVDCLMPYDERLEGNSKYSGTRTEFPQRALRHFVEELKIHNKPLQEARGAVLDSMSALSMPVIPIRARKTDEQIADLIRVNWVTCSGGSGRLLRHLRDQELVACEQSRFQGLWRKVKSEVMDQRRGDADRKK